MLKEKFFEEYNGFADKRHKRIDSSSLFIVDDRTFRDFDARKQLFPWFCALFVDVKTEDEISLELFGDIPMSNEVLTIIRENNWELKETLNKKLTILIHKGEQSKILKLAYAIGAITRKGNTYSTPSFKYICPRTKESLERLVKFLSKCWEEET